MSIGWNEDAQKQFKEVTAIALQMKSVSINQIVRDDLGKSWSLSDSQAAIEVILNTAVLLGDEHLGKLLPNEIKRLHEFYQNLHSGVQHRLDMSLDKGSGNQDLHNGSLARLRTAYGNLETVRPILTFLQSTNPKALAEINSYKLQLTEEVKSWDQSIKAAAEKSHKESDSLGKKISELSTELDKKAVEQAIALKKAEDAFSAMQADYETVKVKIQDDLTALKNQLVEAEKTTRDLKAATRVKEMSDHGILFQNLATTHESAAKGWLIATILLSLGVCLFVGTLWYRHAIHPWNGDWVLIASGTSLAAVIGSIAAWSSRNHRRNKHNQIVALHRAKTLQSFMQLYNTLDNKDQSKEIIVMKSLEAIFSPIPTGYASEERGGEDSSSTILEVVRNTKNN